MHGTGVKTSLVNLCRYAALQGQWCFLNFDPETNYPELLREFLQSFHANAGVIPHIRFLEAQHTLAKEEHNFHERCEGIQIGKVM